MWVDVHARSPATSISFPSTLLNAKRQSNILSTRFQSATWIWSAEAAPDSAPGEDRAFRRTYTPPSGKTSSFADIYITVDDRFTLFVDGKLVGASPDSNAQYGWKTSYAFHVPLGAGSNVFAIRGTNLRDVYNGGNSPAGLLTAIQITHSDKSTSVFTSDASWRVSKLIPANFEQPSLDDSKWVAASTLFQNGKGPWMNDVALPSAVVTVGAGTTTRSSTSTSTPTTTPATTTPVTTTLTTGTASPITIASSTSISTSTSSTTNSNAEIPIFTITESDLQITSSSTSVTSSSAISGAASDSQSTDAPTNSSHVGAIVGGVIGGIAALVLLLLLLSRRRLFGRRRHSEKEMETVPDTVYPFLLASPPGLSPNSENSSNLALHRKSSSVAPRQPQRPSTSTQSVRGFNPDSLYGSPQSSQKPLLNSAATTEEQDSRNSHYFQEQDSNRSSATAPVTPGATTLTLSRLQRLQELVAELSDEVADHGEERPYASELRGRIAELTREETASVPPAYQSPTPGPGGDEA